MKGVVFRETLRRNRLALLFWGVGVASMCFLTIIIVPDVQMLKQMAEMTKMMPPALLQMFGASDYEFLATPEGYLALNLFSWLLVALAVYGVLAGMGVTATEEDRGIMDMLLTAPVPRSRLVLEKIGAYLLVIVVILLLMLAGIWLGVAITPAMKIDTARLIPSVIVMIPGVTVVMAFTTLMAALLRRRGPTAGLAALFVMVSYFVDLLGRAAPDSVLAKARMFSFNAYADSVRVVQSGIDWGSLAVLMAATAVMFGGAVYFFNRRDVGV